MADAAAIEDMQIDAVYALVRRDYSDLEIESIITYVGFFDPQLIRDGTYYVAELAGVIVGSGGWARNAEHIRSLCPDLMADEPDDCGAEVIATLTGAPLYHALGYGERGQLRLTLPNGIRVPAVFMEKRLGLAA